MSKAQQFFLPFLKREQVAKETFSFYFDRRQIKFNFLPGQYIRMILPHESADERGTSRFFTIASSPLEKEYLMITVKIIESSFKRVLFDLQSSQSVQFFGPLGNFIFDETDATECVFLAGGIGMTPFYSMITYAAAKQLATPLTLFVGFSHPEEIFFYDELTKVANENPNIKIIYTLTQQETARKKWTGETGRISTSLITKYIPALLNPTYYLVGSPLMVETMQQLLRQMKIPEERIKVEEFSGY